MPTAWFRSNCLKILPSRTQNGIGSTKKLFEQFFLEKLNLKWHLVLTEGIHTQILKTYSIEAPMDSQGLPYGCIHRSSPLIVWAKVTRGRRSRLRHQFRTKLRNGLFSQYFIYHFVTHEILSRMVYNSPDFYFDYDKNLFIKTGMVQCVHEKLKKIKTLFSLI